MAITEYRPEPSFPEQQFKIMRVCLSHKVVGILSEFWQSYSEYVCENCVNTFFSVFFLNIHSSKGVNFNFQRIIYIKKWESELEKCHWKKWQSGCWQEACCGIERTESPVAF